MSPETSQARITSIQPVWAIPGGRITVEGADLVTHGVPTVQVGACPARVVRASSRAVSVIVPAEVDGGHAAVRIEGVLGETAFVDLGAPIATGLHQVDSPVIDDGGQLYFTYSGTRGADAAVSLFRVGRDGFREPFVSGMTNATSMALAPDGRLHVSSRFDGTVYRVEADGRYELVASDLGVACGLAFDRDGTLYVGDRSGTVFRMEPSGQPKPFAAVPQSVAAFHLAWGPDDALYVTAPTLAPRDHVYRVDSSGTVETVCSVLGRPQGLAFDAQGTLYVVEALAGVSGLYRIESDGSATRMLAAPALVGLAFDPAGGLVVVSSDTAYRLDLPLRPLRASERATIKSSDRREQPG